MSFFVVEEEFAVFNLHPKSWPDKLSEKEWKYVQDQVNDFVRLLQYVPVENTNELVIKSQAYGLDEWLTEFDLLSDYACHDQPEHVHT